MAVVVEVKVALVSVFDHFMSQSLASREIFKSFSSYHSGKLNSKSLKLMNYYSDIVNQAINDKYCLINETCSSPLRFIDTASLMSQWQSVIEVAKTIKQQTRHFNSYYSRDQLSVKISAWCGHRSLVEEHSKQSISCLNDKIRETVSDIPELLKLVAETAFDLMQSFQYIDDAVEAKLASGYTNAIGEYIMNILDFLSDPNVVSSSQRYLVLDMKAGLLSQLGQNALMESPPASDAAFDYLSQAVSLYENDLVQVSSDRRSYLFALSSLANVFCLKRQFTVGLATFARAIDLESSFLGAGHHNLFLKLVNAGMCASEYGARDEQAKVWLGRALSIIDDAGDVSADIRSTIESKLSLLHKRSSDNISMHSTL